MHLFILGLIRYKSECNIFLLPLYWDTMVHVFHEGVVQVHEKWYACGHFAWVWIVN